MTISHDYQGGIRAGGQSTRSLGELNESRNVHMTLAIPRPAFFAACGGAMILIVLLLSGMTLVVDGRASPETSTFLKKLLWVDNERNLPTALSFSIIATACMLVTITSWQQFSVSSKWRWHWAGLGVLLLYIAFDEAAQIHERLNGPLQSMAPDTGAFHYAWVIGGMAFVLIIGLIFLRFILSLPVIVSSLVVVSGATFVTGAIGMEMLGGTAMYAENWWFTYSMATMMEEGLEMAGMLIFATAIVTLLYQEAPGTKEYMSSGH